MKTTVVEMVNTTTNTVIGYSPVLIEKGKRPKMIIENGTVVSFSDRKSAKTYGDDHITKHNL